MPVPTRSDFLLDPDLVFLNHGSFGAVPRTVQEECERLQREMERNPVEWLGRRSDDLMRTARSRVADLVGADRDDLVFFPNPTTAVNMVVRSLDLDPGDTIVMTNLEYGAMDRTWDRLAAECGATVVRAAIDLPVSTAADVVEPVWACVDERTKVLFLSHLTSSTALVLPVAELCRRARERGILTIVDGAHVPGHVPLDLATLGADVYTGALHKWVCAPKGCSFLWARPEVQPMLLPLVTSWGWDSDHPSGSTFIDHHEWQGTRDLTPFLGAVAALDFMAAHDWAAVRSAAHADAGAARAAVDRLTGGARPRNPLRIGMAGHHQDRHIGGHGPGALPIPGQTAAGAGEGVTTGGGGARRLGRGGHGQGQGQQTRQRQAPGQHPDTTTRMAHRSPLRIGPLWRRVRSA